MSNGFEVAASFEFLTIRDNGIQIEREIQNSIDERKITAMLWIFLQPETT